VSIIAKIGTAKTDRARAFEKNLFPAKKRAQAAAAACADRRGRRRPKSSLCAAPVATGWQVSDTEMHLLIRLHLPRARACVCVRVRAGSRTGSIRSLDENSMLQAIGLGASLRGKSAHLLLGAPGLAACSQVSREKWRTTKTLAPRFRLGPSVMPGYRAEWTRAFKFYRSPCFIRASESRGGLRSAEITIESFQFSSITRTRQQLDRGIVSAFRGSIPLLAISISR